MTPNIKALLILLKEKFDNNQSEMARALNVERTHLNKMFKCNGKGAGATICGAIIKYCNENNLDYTKYIFLK
nr:MAG TPA: NinH protein [Caudoviricetes sp.]DAW71692.1 MAG TPA: NinH protein [Caudoviricetes sp.]